jgi:hypothetical protein
MQRCPYIHEMKERLLSSQGSNPEQKLLEGMDKDVLEIHGDPAVGTVVKVQSLLLGVSRGIPLQSVVLPLVLSCHLRYSSLHSSHHSDRTSRLNAASYVMFPGLMQVNWINIICMWNNKSLNPFAGTMI